MAAEIAIGIIVFGSIIMFLIQSLELNKRHAGLKLLFNLLSVWLVVLGVNIAKLMAEGEGLSAGIVSNLSTFYIVVMFAAYFVTGYWIFMFLKDIVYPRYLGKEKRELIDHEEDSSGGMN